MDGHGFDVRITWLQIIIVVVTLFMGWRMGVVIGFALIFSLLATFILMALMGIDLQRVSLGALIIALGMMVDNAIVVADGYVLRRQKGMAPEGAAVRGVRPRPQGGRAAG